MKTTGLDITRFMLDDAFWHGAATTDEAYLINGEHFTGNILPSAAKCSFQIGQNA